MATIQVHVCDVCGGEVQSESAYRIASGKRSVEVDLCEKHARPVDELLKVGRRHGGRRQVRSDFEASIATMEEIEAMKRGRAARV